MRRAANDPGGPSVAASAAAELAMTMMLAAEGAFAAGDAASAVTPLCAALAIEPGNPIALYGLANALARCDDKQAAVETLYRAIASAPAFDMALTDLGGNLIELERSAEAVAPLRRSLALTPADPRTLHNLAVSLMSVGIEAAQAAYPRTFAVRVDPTADSTYLQRFHYGADFSAEEIFRAHVAWGLRHRRAAMSPFAFANMRDRARPLRIAYLSADLGRHPVGHLLAAGIAHHTAGALHITVCDTGTSFDDPVTAELRRLTDRWIDLRGLDDEAALRVLRAAEIDICVDLSGHTPGNRLPLFAARVAPVQASWLGYWNTTGLPEIDYLLTCADEVPPARERFFVERVVPLPMGRFCYALPSYAPPVAPPPAAHRGYVTFGCFANRPVHTAQLAAWAAILRAVPRSRLVLRSRQHDAPSARARIVGALAMQGVVDAAARIDFHGQVLHDALLAAYGEIDIALDAFPFSGLMTSLEALAMGVPVVTLQSARIESRQTLAILIRLGLADLAASQADDYVASAVALARDPARRHRLRDALRPLVADRLCDGIGFSRGLEQVYRRLWTDFCDRATAGY